MATLKEEAQAYEPKQTKNIAELEKVQTDLELFDGEGKDKDGNVFKYKYIKVEGIEYRVPGTVLGGIKAIIKKMPYVKFVTVDKEGSGMSTEYHVMPYIEPTEEKVE